MSWIEVVAIILVGTGLVAGGYMVAQRPSFWIEFGSRVVTAITPIIWKVISKRMSPEEEAAWRREQLTGVKPPNGTGVTTGKTITQPAKTRSTK